MTNRFAEQLAEWEEQGICRALPATWEGPSDTPEDPDVAWLRGQMFDVAMVADAAEIKPAALHTLRVSRSGVVVFEPDRIVGGTHFYSFASLVRITMLAKLQAMLGHADLRRVWVGWVDDLVYGALFAPVADQELFLRAYIFEPGFPIQFENQTPLNPAPHFAINVTMLSRDVLRRVHTHLKTSR